MYRSIVTISSFLLVTLLVTSCVTTDVTRMNNKTYPRVHPNDVQIFLSKEDIKSEFEYVALIFSEGNTNWTGKDDLIKKSRREAGKLGANAIIISGIDEPSSGAKVAGEVFGTGTERQGEIVAIRLLEKASTAPSNEQDN